MRKLTPRVMKLGYLLLVLTAFGVVQAFPQESAAPAKPASEAFKNIQVLKDMPADQLMPTMKSFTKALGVKCDFCHVQGAFDKDDKHPKEVARHMITMAQEINTAHFHGHPRVTCWTCHRGAQEPESKPPEAAQ
jgi:Photosynthetic reaction centre cytochrome C subunit